MKNSHFNSFFKIFEILIFFIFVKILVSNAQTSPDIENRQFSGTGTKNLIYGRIEVLIFIYSKHKACCRVLVVSSVESCVLGTKI